MKFLEFVKGHEIAISVIAFAAAMWALSTYMSGGFDDHRHALDLKRLTPEEEWRTDAMERAERLEVCKKAGE